jgi:hypothetical protein
MQVVHGLGKCDKYPLKRALLLGMLETIGGSTASSRTSSRHTYCTYRTYRTYSTCSNIAVVATCAPSTSTTLILGVDISVTTACDTTAGEGSITQAK